MKIRRWKKSKDSQQKTSELRLDDGRLAANVSRSKGFGWYWVAGWDCGLMIPYNNSAANGVRGLSEEEAKAAETALRDPFHTPPEREKRAAHYLRAAEAIERGEPIGKINISSA